MHHLPVFLSFLTNIRGWQLIIILMVLLVFILVQGLFGFVVGRRTSRPKRKKKYF